MSDTAMSQATNGSQQGLSPVAGTGSTPNSTNGQDRINPEYYRKHPSGVECIQVTEHFTFNLGNAIKYIWRAGLKGKAIDDLRKASWYIDREIKRLESFQGKNAL